MLKTYDIFGSPRNRRFPQSVCALLYLKNENEKKRKDVV
jgi:hypothetical protein